VNLAVDWWGNVTPCIEVGVGVQGAVNLVAPQIDLDWNVPDNV
jgi:hypothetical protein